MHNKTTAKPENLSDTEWKLLLHIATFGDSFDANEVFVKLHPSEKNSSVNSPLAFKQHFYRLKNAGLLTMIPVAYLSAVVNAIPSYRLTALGKKTVDQYQ